MGKAKIIEWRKAKLAPVLLVFGSESFFSNAAIRRLKEQAREANPGVELYEVDAVDYVAGDLQNMITPSLFSDPKLVIISGVERASDALIEDGKKLEVSSLEDSTVIFQHAGTSTRGKALLDSLRADDQVIEISCAKISKDNEKSAFVQGQFTEANRKVTQAAVRALVDAFGNDIAELASSIDQLLADSSEQIDEELVDRYFGGRIEATSWRIFDAALAGKTGEALLLLRHAVETGSDLIYMLGGFATKIRQMCQVYGKPNVTADSLGMNPFALTQTKKALAGWDDEGLARALKALVDADAAAKGSERQPMYRVEQLLILVSNRGRV